MKRRTRGSAAAVWCVFLCLSAATAFAAEPRGYTARPCGFDMDRNGVIGEPADRLVGDGVTADPDGDGPADGAEDIVVISGVFSEALTIKDNGVPGYYVRDNFQFPSNPLMIIGWDKDQDGEYPPYDADDVAVLDGNTGSNNLAIGITTDGK